MAEKNQIPTPPTSSSIHSSAAVSPSSPSKKGFFYKLLKRRAVLQASTTLGTLDNLLATRVLSARGPQYLLGDTSSVSRNRSLKRNNKSSSSGIDDNNTRPSTRGRRGISFSDSHPGTEIFATKSNAEPHRSRRSRSRSNSNAPNGNCIDNEKESIYNEEDVDNDTVDHFRGSDTASLGSSVDDSSSFGSLSDQTSETTIGERDKDEKIKFPSIVDKSGNDLSLGSEGDDTLPWLNLTYESLLFPKYIRNFRKNKHSPKILNNVFLAQELQFESKDVFHDFESNSIDSAEVNDFEKLNRLKSSLLKDGPRNVANKSGEIFVMEFSRDGKYLAAAGRDSTIKIWKVISSPLARLEFRNYEFENSENGKKCKSRDKTFRSASIFHQEPIRVLKGHRHSILSLDWSKNNFLISGSMDRTVKLWHVDRDECLDTFEHEDFVTCVKFHPLDDRFFLSGSLDNNARLWSILEKQVAYSKNLGDDVLITASSFTPDGKYCIIGGFNGSIYALETKGLYVIHRVEIKDRSLVHPFRNKNDNKITGIKVFKNSAPPKAILEKEPLAEWNFLITTNDSKIRLVNTSLKKLVTRFKGLTNVNSSIVANTSADYRYIICGSEDHWCYIWENNNTIINNRLKVALKDLMIEGKHHISDMHKHKKSEKEIEKGKGLSPLGPGDESSLIANENSSYATFHAHHSSVNVAMFAPLATTKLLESSDDVIYQLAKRGLEKKSTELLRSLSSEDEPENNYNDTSHGFIIVTTDDKGLIRIFRQDSGYKFRKALLDIYKHEKNHKNKQNEICSSPRINFETKNMNSKASSLKLDIGKKLTRRGKSLSSHNRCLPHKRGIERVKGYGFTTPNTSSEDLHPRGSDIPANVVASSALMTSANIHNQSSPHLLSSSEGSLHVTNELERPLQKDSSFNSQPQEEISRSNSHYTLATPVDENGPSINQHSNKSEVPRRDKKPPLIVRTKFDDDKSQHIDFQTPTTNSKLQHY
ncbi:uncharacterized protein PRCAT00004018001 [Priceomyces carsonii]|uniref:uncharacterized protein n=1 Tax=Priceomyces carsonii TaxID=28549 RepID=UPI002EDA9F15|nr:unnamed protein product [Priceomyces carsonii]